MSVPGAERRAGLLALFGAFGTWGLLPLYLRLLKSVSPLEIMSHRVVWCAVFVLGWLGVGGELGRVRGALRAPATRWRLAASAVLISINWITYVWAVANQDVLEASLGYFINPLLNVLLGVFVLGERLNRVEWVAVAIAAAGVAYLTWIVGAPPWIALVLAGTFGCYGLLRKTVGVDALVGLGTETLLIAPFGVGYLVFSELGGRGMASYSSPLVVGLLVGGGPLTAIPLALFAFGARRVPFSTVGLVQYLGPTLQLLLGVFLFREPFSLARGIGFALIWLALLLYGGDAVRRSRGERA